MEIRPNRIKQKLANGELAYIVAGLTNADDIDAFGPNGYDGVWLEGEHGNVDATNLGNLTRACDLWSMTSVVRVNRNDQGVNLSHVGLRCNGNHRATCQHEIRSTKRRGWREVRTYRTPRYVYGVVKDMVWDNYFEVANSQTLLVVLIEDIVAINNLDEILTVDHIDVFFVAPSDLATSMGHIGNHNHPDVQNTIDAALARIQDAGRVAGTMTTDDTVEKYVKAGVQFLLIGVWGWISSGASQYKLCAEKSKN